MTPRNKKYSYAQRIVRFDYSYICMLIRQNMNKSRIYVAWVVYLVVACLCQALFGRFPADAFAFPVNVAIMLLWVIASWVVYRERKPAWLATLLLSPQTTFILLAAFVAVSLIQGFHSTGLSSAWWLVAVIAALLTHLLFVTMRGTRRDRSRLARFLLIHFGVLLAIGGGFWGAPDTRQWRMAVGEKNPTCEAIDSKGRVTYLDHELRLKHFNTELYPDGTPKSHAAKIVIDGKDEATLTVNHPYALSWKDDLYLMGATPQYCIIGWVSQPWKYVQWVGVWMIMAGAVLLFVQGAGHKTIKGGQT